MQWGRSCRARGAAAAVSIGACVVRASIALAAAALLSACNTTGSPNATLTGTRGASVAFESIDGPPPDIFRKLVARLNEEAQTRRLAVVSRETPSTYRVRGYLAARVEGNRTSVSWLWDVYDAENRRAFRITGAQARPGKHKAAEAWNVADDAMLKAIAGASLDQLAAFLTATDAPAMPDAPATPAADTAVTADASSPEAAGIFRIFRPKADPLPADAVPGATGSAQDGTQDSTQDSAHDTAVPLPPLKERIAAVHIPVL